MLTNCTFSRNQALIKYGAGIYGQEESSLTVANCIFWADMPDEIRWTADYNVNYSDVQEAGRVLKLLPVHCSQFDGLDNRLGTEDDNRDCFLVHLHRRRNNAVSADGLISIMMVMVERSPFDSDADQRFRMIHIPSKGVLEPPGFCRLWTGLMRAQEILT
jgi:hypothetical protein